MAWTLERVDEPGTLYATGGARERGPCGSTIGRRRPLRFRTRYGDSSTKTPLSPDESRSLREDPSREFWPQLAQRVWLAEEVVHAGG